jgi:hypothetical protein
MRDRSKRMSVGDCCSCRIVVTILMFVVVPDQHRSTAILVACGFGHLDVARWLVTNAGSDVRSERDNVSCRSSCRRLCASLLCRERRSCACGVSTWSEWLYSPSAGLCPRLP